MTANSAFPPFNLADNGMTRFPPNVEQITVERGRGSVAWLTVRRNEETWRFSLKESEADHLIGLLRGAFATAQTASPDS